MAIEIRWSPEASDDVVRIAEFISRDSENYAKIVVEKILSATEILPEFPCSGRIVPEFTEESIRELFIYSYRLIYEIREEIILIVAVIHGKRMLDINNRI